MGSSGRCLAWFAVHVRLRYERRVAAALRNKGCETFLPLCRSQRRWCERAKELCLQLFPGYLRRFEAVNRVPNLTAPGLEIAVVRAIPESGWPVCGDFW